MCEYVNFFGMYFFECLWCNVAVLLAWIFFDFDFFFSFCSSSTLLFKEINKFKATKITLV